MSSLFLVLVLMAALAFAGGVAVCLLVSRRGRVATGTSEARVAAGTAMGERLEAVIQSIEAGVVVLDPDQRITNLNRAAESILMVSPALTRGRLVQEALRQSELNRAVADAMRGISEEREITLAGEEPRNIRLVFRPLLDASNQRAGLILILNDLTHLRRLETMRTDFASNVSHELRTPITNIKGYIETLLDPSVTADAEQTEQFLRIIARNADRLIAIVEDMLMLAQLERPESKDTLAVQPARLQPIIEAVVSSLAAEAQGRSITITQECDAGLTATVNPPLIEQAIANLVMNAIRYSKPPAPVHIRASVMAPPGVPANVRIDVIDRGPGIAEEHLERIFERFYRVDKDRSRERGGTGLGLAIVKHIMNLHRGSVEVESSLGRGSTFSLVLPGT